LKTKRDGITKMMRTTTTKQQQQRRQKHEGNKASKINTIACKGVMIWLIAYQFSTPLTATQQDDACKLSTVDKQEPLLNDLIRC
jgi:hypothetical protein